MKILEEERKESKKIDEEIIENKKGEIIIDRRRNLGRLRLVNIKGTIVIREDNEVDEVRIEDSNVEKLRILTRSIVTIKNTKIRDGLIVDISPS